MPKQLSDWWTAIGPSILDSLLGGGKSSGSLGRQEPSQIFLDSREYSTTDWMRSSRMRWLSYPKVQSEMDLTSGSLTVLATGSCESLDSRFFFKYTMRSAISTHQLTERALTLEYASLWM